MSEIPEDPSVELRIAYADGGTILQQTIIHGGPSQMISLGFTFKPFKGEMSVIVGNIPSFDGDAKKQVGAIKDILSILTNLFEDPQVVETIEQEMNEEADDHEEWEDDEEE